MGLPRSRMYSAASRNSSIGRADAALQQDRLARLAHGLEQRVVLHVARADLQHVGVLGDHRDVLGGHHLGDDRQAGLGARGGEHLQALLLVPLEAVGAGARLERTAAKAGRARSLSCLARATICSSLSTEHGPAMTATRAAAHLEAPGLHHGPLRLQLRGGPLVRGHDRQDLLHPLARLEHLGEPRPLLAEGRDHGLVLPVDHLGGQAQRDDVLGHVLDLRRRCIRFHDHDHGTPPSLWAGSVAPPTS